MRYGWRTIDYRPEPTKGWRVVILNGRTCGGDIKGDGYSVFPMPGWLIQEEIKIELDSFDEERTVTPTGDHRVVAAKLDDCQLAAVDEYSSPSFWMILMPGEAEPSPQEEIEQRARIKLHAERAKARQERKEATAEV